MAWFTCGRCNEDNFLSDVDCIASGIKLECPNCGMVSTIYLRTPIDVFFREIWRYIWSWWILPFLAARERRIEKKRKGA
jgi:hypothetical protein